MKLYCSYTDGLSEAWLGDTVVCEDTKLAVRKSRASIAVADDLWGSGMIAVWRGSIGLGGVGYIRGVNYRRRCGKGSTGSAIRRVRINMDMKGFHMGIDL